MRRPWVMGLAWVVAGWALASQAAPAQEVLPGVTAVSGSPYAAPPNYNYGAALGLETPEPPPPPRGFVKKCASKAKHCLNTYGLCCWTNHNTLGCNTFEAEYRFIFGSCRTFYGEPCEQKPPAPQPGMPGFPGAPGMSGYGRAPGGCACP